MNKWTQYGLSNAALQRLSAICNNRSHKSGMALTALESRGLVASVLIGHPDQRRTRKYVPTDIGCDALEEARREGW